MGAVTEEAKAHKAQYGRENWNMYKSAGICPYCKTRYAEPGLVHCAQCLRLRRELHARSDPGNVHQRELCRERRARLKEAGICVRCGKNPAREGRTRCQACEDRKRESDIKYNIMRRMDREAREARER